MTRLNVNATRMELSRLKARLKTATRGHKLLKDKSDEMVRRFIVLAKENRTLRREVERELIGALNGFVIAKALMPSPILEEVLCVTDSDFKIDVSTRNIMGVEAPVFSVDDGVAYKSLSYGFASVASDFDESVETLSNVFVKLLKLAEIEKTCNMLAIEIEKNRRRVNALEFVMIPQLEETIKYITMKLDENERGNLTRLMKVKTMINGK